MKTLVILGVLACLALTVPVTSAHIILTVGEDCTAGSVIDAPVHAGFWIGRCEFNHEDPSPLAALP